MHMHRSWVRAADSAQFGAWRRVVLPVSGAAVPSVCTVGPLFASWLSGAQTAVRELIDRAMDQREMELTPRVQPRSRGCAGIFLEVWSEAKWN